MMQLWKEILVPLLHNPFLYLTLSLLIFLLSKSARAHININGIINSYKTVLKNNDLIGTFVIAPLFLGIAIAISIGNTLDSDSINFIVTLVSILVSMFFWYISFFSDYKSESTNASVNETIKIIIMESKDIVNFEILESVFLLITSLLFPIIKNYGDETWGIYIYSALLYWCFINLILNLLVLIKKHSSLH